MTEYVVPDIGAPELTIPMDNWEQFTYDPTGNEPTPTIGEMASLHGVRKLTRARRAEAECDYLTAAMRYYAEASDAHDEGELVVAFVASRNLIRCRQYAELLLPRGSGLGVAALAQATKEYSGYWAAATINSEPMYVSELVNVWPETFPPVPILLSGKGRAKLREINTPDEPRAQRKEKATAWLHQILVTEPQDP